MPQSLIPRRLFCCFATRSTIRHLPTPSETLPPRRAARMITRFLTSVSTAFSPFNPKSGKTARNFLALLPPNARSTMKIDVKQLSRADADKPGLLALKFSNTREHSLVVRHLLTQCHRRWQRNEPRFGHLEDQGHHDRSGQTLAHARQKGRACWLDSLRLVQFHFALGGARRFMVITATCWSLGFRFDPVHSQSSNHVYMLAFATKLRHAHTTFNTQHSTKICAIHFSLHVDVCI